MLLVGTSPIIIRYARYACVRACVRACVPACVCYQGETSKRLTHRRFWRSSRRRKSNEMKQQFEQRNKILIINGFHRSSRKIIYRRERRRGRRWRNRTRGNCRETQHHATRVVHPYFLGTSPRYQGFFSFGLSILPFLLPRNSILGYDIERCLLNFGRIR